MSSASPDRNVPPSAPGWRNRGMLLVLAGVAVLAAGFGIATRVRSHKILREDTEAAAAPLVSVITAERGTAQQELVLPGTAQAFIDAPIYARTSGYLRKWYADIGTRVRKGELLAEIESPETDQQLLQARAELGTARANERLARVTADRYTELIKSDSVSKQDVDNAVETLAARRADVASAEANVRRLEQLVSFERIEAPFDGVITARNTDIGQLVDAGASGGTSLELFHIATTGTLRVFVAVPQTASPSATPGVPVDVTLIERPGKAFPGKIVRNAHSSRGDRSRKQRRRDPSGRRGRGAPEADRRQHDVAPSGERAHVRVGRHSRRRARAGQSCVAAAGHPRTRPRDQDRDHFGSSLQRTGHQQPSGLLGRRTGRPRCQARRSAAAAEKRIEPASP